MHNDFDIASQHYDSVFTFSKIGKAQRRIVFKYLNPILNQDKKLSVLELNCGTGEDAIQFAKQGHEVIATDISEGMIAVAKSKLKLDNLNFLVQDINTITTTSFKNKFDLIFSNFGGVNCLSKTQLTSFVEKSVNLLKPNGRLILVIMPKHCLWERLYFSLKGNFKKAKRRQTTKPVIANVDGVEVKTWYYNPEAIVELTKLKYSKEKLKPIGLAIPPSYLEDSFLAKKPVLSILKFLDTILTGAFFSKYADHFLIQLKKK